jgi:hypothetical protein
MCSLYPTDRLTSAPAVVPTQKIGSSVAPMMTTNTSPSRGGGNENGDKKKEESDEVWGYLEAQSSFLGPSLWDNGDLKVRKPYILYDFKPCVCSLFHLLGLHIIEILSRLGRT